MFGRSKFRMSIYVVVVRHVTYFEVLTLYQQLHLNFDES